MDYAFQAQPLVSNPSGDGDGAGAVTTSYGFVN